MQPLDILIAIFLLAAGVCVGSFLNVVIWRLPNMMHGAVVSYGGKTGKLTLNWPPSHCPHCDNAIPWYLNVPVFGWFMLAGQCARCRKPIAIRYPIVELATGILFLATFLAYHSGTIHGELVMDRDWPALGLHLVFISALLCAAAIDADTYYIPLSIPVVITILALAVAPLTDSRFIPTLPQEQWMWGKPIAGASVGLLLANILLFFKVLPQSFSGEHFEKEIEKEEKSDNARKKKADDKNSSEKKDEDRIDPIPNLTKKLSTAIIVIICLFAIAASWLLLPAFWASLVTISAGLIVFLAGVFPRDADARDDTDEVMEEISTAGARREILKELLFILFPICGALIANILPIALPYSPWLARLLAALAGLLIGAGSIWIIRILGTLWKGIEAMGLGDVYLLAGIGAVLGPSAVVITFPLLSAFLALGWAGIRYFTKGHTILPFGPWLAMAAIPALFFGQSLLNWYLNAFVMIPGSGGR